MAQTNYQTIFEIGFRTFPWTGVVRPLILVACGALLAVVFKRKPFYRFTGVFGSSFGLLVFILLLITFVSNFVKLRSAYRSGTSSIIEGVVENFHPAPVLGPAEESFLVQGTIFSYNAMDDTPCFHNAPIHAGPIRNGLDVRVYYNDGCIQRVDIRRGLAPPNN
jgi:hypothetical protein